MWAYFKGFHGVNQLYDRWASSKMFRLRYRDSKNQLPSDGPCRAFSFPRGLFVLRFISRCGAVWRTDMPPSLFSWHSLAVASVLSVAVSSFDTRHDWLSESKIRSTQKVVKYKLTKKKRTGYILVCIIVHSIPNNLQTAALKKNQSSWTWEYLYRPTIIVGHDFFRWWPLNFWPMFANSQY